MFSQSLNSCSKISKSRSEIIDFLNIQINMQKSCPIIRAGGPGFLILKSSLRVSVEIELSDSRIDYRLIFLFSFYLVVFNGEIEHGVCYINS